MTTVLVILLIILNLYTGFIAVPAALIFRFAFSRKECSVPLCERDLIGTRYEPYRKELVEADSFLRALPLERVTVRARDGERLCGYYLDNRSDKTMIFMHGYRGEPISNFCLQARHYYEKGWNLLFIVQRAHGESGGRHNGLGCLEQYDLLSWIDLAAQRENVESIAVYGSSMGGAAVAFASDKITEKRVKALVVDCGFASVRDQLTLDSKKRRLPYSMLLPVMRLIGRLVCGMDIYYRAGESLSKTDIPVLFIHGDADSTVPVECARENFDACRSKKEFITVKGAQHITAYAVGGKETADRIDRFIDAVI